jgi:nucleoside 2-deoxyribosyltransferase
MAMKFGDKILNDIVDNYYKPAVGKTGFSLFRLEDQPKAGLIDDRIRVEIRTSSFLISDLTHDNPGAYWEAGFAEGLGKPVIYTCEKGKFQKDKTHFDTNHHLTVVWDKDNPQEGANLLKSTIRATLPDSSIMVDE